MQLPLLDPSSAEAVPPASSSAAAEAPEGVGDATEAGPPDAENGSSALAA